jgi:hypothetical protein
MNTKMFLVLFVAAELFWCAKARPKPLGSAAELVLEVDTDDGEIAIDFETLKSYVDGSWKDKYDDSSFDGYQRNHKHNCNGVEFQRGCHFKHNSSIGSDWLGYKSKSKAVLGAGYDHEKQKVYGTELEHKGTLQVGESSIKYEGEAVSSASYDETKLGGSIGPKVGGSVKGTAFGVGLGASIQVGLAAEGGLNSHEKNVGLKAVTPAGAYGVKIGCKTEVCVVGCFSISVC